MLKNILYVLSATNFTRICKYADFHGINHLNKLQKGKIMEEKKAQQHFYLKAVYLIDGCPDYQNSYYIKTQPWSQEQHW